MADNRKMIDRVLEAIPQQAPFRFIDDILDIDEQSVTSSYRFTSDAFFFKGHFPGNPITPGVILVETMAQAGVAALGIYQLLKDLPQGASIDNLTPLFVFIDHVEFLHPVKPGDRVVIQGEKIYFRRGNIKSRTSIQREDGLTICHGVLTGTGVKH
ncbi:MAG: 3-hydroxyacyl-ACP dehydratase FabZ family protein [Thermodesulfobacteriota bacterium]|nr:3-hydroxyacyl-ACP dehydratase FabZ family protein [Thermodesulfobacteriota bacterium]